VNVFVSQTGGTQFQDEGVNRGGPAPSFVNFTGNGVTATYAPSSDTVVVNIPGGGGGGGTPVMFAKHGVNQTNGTRLIYEGVTMYAPSKGQYDTNTGIFTVLADGFFSFSASAVITFTYAPGVEMGWYLGIGTYDPNTVKSVIYAMSQFVHLYPSDSYVQLGSSVSVSLPLTIGKKIAVRFLDRYITSAISLQSYLFFQGGSENPSESSMTFMPTFSVIYYPLV
jgi:hypothetical protein